MSALSVEPGPGTGARVPVLVFRSDPPAAAVRALVSLASSPHVVHRVAGMADLHVGKEVCVGTVFATEHHAFPAALGGDLGCGIVAQRFDLHAPSLDRRTLRDVLDALALRIPVGDRTHSRASAPSLPDALAGAAFSTHALARTRDTHAPRHLGTLGGGNHFVELDRDAGGSLWALVHTGSRGMGAAVAAHHRRAAGDSVLASLDVRTEAGRAYVNDLAVACSFARANREAIMGHVRGVLFEQTGAAPIENESEGIPSHIESEHNFARFEEHEGASVLVHRKGAAYAGAGAWGLVPGSMGTATYVVRGKGASESFCSCSHGAGRVYSRSAAHRALDARAVARSLRHVEVRADRAEALVEEAPQAYRDLRSVLEEQRRLIEPVLRLEPLAVLKG